MNKIKIVGIIIFTLSMTLAAISLYISSQSTINNNILKTINQQKAHIQDISKNVFYIYKNKSSSSMQLEKSIKYFLNNMKKRDNIIKEVSTPLIKKQSDKIIILWNKFYKIIQKFKKQNKVSTPYTNIVLDETIKEIYNINLSLIIEFDKLIVIEQQYFYKLLRSLKIIEYSIFFILLILFAFFLTYIFKTTNNIEFLIKKIDNTIKSIDNIENKVEVVLDSIEENNKEIVKNEDTIIQSLDELINSQIKLKNLQADLESLIKLKK